MWRSDDGGDHWSRVNCRRGDLRQCVLLAPRGRPAKSGRRLLRGPVDPPLVRWRQDLDGSSRARRAATTITSSGSIPSIRIIGSPRSDQGAVVTVNDGRTWSSWYNQPTGSVLSSRRRQSLPLLDLQRPAGQRHRRHREPQRLWGASPSAIGIRSAAMSATTCCRTRTILIWCSAAAWAAGCRATTATTGQVANVTPWPINTYGAKPTTVKYRFGWVTPMAFTAAKPHALLFGAQVLFRSTDEGDHWDIISPDLTGQGGRCPRLQRAGGQASRRGHAAMA